MLSDWQIRIANGVAYVHKRKYWFGLIAVPWHLSGGTRVVMTPDTYTDVLEAATKYVLDKDPHATIQINFKPWS